MLSRRMLKSRINLEKCYHLVIRWPKRLEGFQGFQISCLFQVLETEWAESGYFLAYDISGVCRLHTLESKVLNNCLFRDSKTRWVHTALLNGQSILHFSKGLRELINRMKTGTFRKHSKEFLGNWNISILIY